MERLWKQTLRGFRNSSSAFGFLLCLDFGFKVGVWCMGLSGAYTDPVPDDVGISIIKNAFDRGITFFDASDIYGPKTNKMLVRKELFKALKQLPRKKVQLATKFGIGKSDSTGGLRINGTPEYVRTSLEASLKCHDV